MFTYKDKAGQRVDLFEEPGAAGMPPGHVLIAARVRGSWLMTDHPKRGLEWPGGKLEDGETPEQAAVREAYEETGAVIGNLRFIADYVVQADPPFCKRVFAADVCRLDEKAPLRETRGAAWLTEADWGTGGLLSSHMDDEGMRRIRRRVISLETGRND
ncbi:NUDIX domain-containing protein [Bhargavaea ullalensis]|uniref:8-oxo-dGTP diphosphatase n=1 Tax=Bhargavaea ullalensis TaxID=1265685 RepID=A0ABV2GB88_9BACL